MNKLSYIFLFLLVSLSASAQTFTLKGTVKETNGTPLLGATIVVKESHIGTSTDMEGHFNIKAQVGQTLEVITKIGRASCRERV